MSAGDPRPNLLFLCHRIPFPPDKGDKIRSYHWLRALAEAFRVHLVAFVDDPADWAHRDKVERLCTTCLLLPLHSTTAKVWSLWGLVTGEPLSLPYYRDRRLMRELRRLRESITFTHVFVYSSAMAQYALVRELTGVRRVIDFVDVDSDKWRQYAARVRGPMRWLYSREANRLERVELSVARAFGASVFVSKAEADWFRNRVGLREDRVTHINNGVDTTYFDPDLVYESPYPEGLRPVVFTGAMDYWANVDAVTWFTRKVWPSVRAKDQQAVFYIVGARPTAAVRDLAGEDVVVTGRVPDVRPYLRHAVAAVAPMWIARGVQNKVLEAMSMALPIVVSTKGLEGIMALDSQQVLVADDALQFAQQVVRSLNRDAAAVGRAARCLVQREYSWQESCSRLVKMLEGFDHTLSPVVSTPTPGIEREKRYAT